MAARALVILVLVLIGGAVVYLATAEPPYDPRPVSEAVPVERLRG